MALKIFDKLFQNFIELLNDKDNYNELEKMKIMLRPLSSSQAFLLKFSISFLIADELELEELAKKIETFLIETKVSWLRTHHPSPIFEQSDFNSLLESKLNCSESYSSSKKNITTLKTTLQQCLPYICYFHKSVDENISHLSESRTQDVRKYVQSHRKDSMPQRIETALDAKEGQQSIS
ncbi:hypothetical protein Glove_117g103 [Diversispora epigaea]|uniref:Uncharacterized protein n=1 Tax=Diversispora epigaea TaxID=1348612 RepID=A0A397J4Z7_9GLOM|nr:hypothetical protein Glove_117g103 [Diversispora epigaea]